MTIEKDVVLFRSFVLPTSTEMRFPDFSEQVPNSPKNFRRTIFHLQQQTHFVSHSAHHRHASVNRSPPREQCSIYVYDDNREYE